MVRPTVALYAKPDGLSIRLVETLLSSFCFVKILSEEKKTWEDVLGHVPQKNLFQIVNPNKQKDQAVFEYLILLNENLSFSETQVVEGCRLAAAQSSKILVLLPFNTESLESWQLREDTRATILKKMPEAGIVYVGDIYGPRYLGEDKNFITRSITLSQTENRVEDGGEAPVYPLFLEALVKYLTRSVFSFGPYGKEVILFSEEIVAHRLLSYISLNTSKEVAVRKMVLKRKEVLGVRNEKIRTDLDRSFQQTLEWFNVYVSSPGVLEKKKTLKNRAFYLKRGALAGAFILFLIPFLLTVVGIFSLLLSLKTPRAIPFGSFANNNAEAFFQVYSQIPLLRLIYKPFVPVANVLASSSDISTDALRVLGNGRALVGSALGDEIYDPSVLSGAIARDLGEIYNKTGLLQGEMKSLKGLFAKIIAKVITESTIEELRGKVLYGKNLAENLPKILGKESPKTYLVLFQNNMELRPTGGFIGSFALVTFDGGRLAEINAFDVYSADGQLKGHVEPPAPIKKYLGEANWFLRDSNWDPDFPTSAERVEWFLDKEIDKKVDGVFALDLEVARGILLATGPVILPDFNQAFDYKNLYENLQNEVESEFFPGSLKKANLMTGLTREIINRLSTLEEDQYLPVAEVFLRSLEERHIQIFFNGEETQKAISGLGYAGEVRLPICPGNCFTDWYSAIDANLGVTKANYFINRSYDLDVTISGGISKKTLIINYENTANPALGVNGRYKTYTRLLVPNNTVFGKVKIDNAGNVVETDLEEEITPEVKEGGIAIEISPGQTKKLIFSWENQLPEMTQERTEYRLYIRKQAGTASDPLNINVLTEDTSASYNTNLARDFFTRIFIK